MNDWDSVMHDADADAEPLPVPRGLAAALVCGVVFLVLVLAALVIWLTTPVARAQVRVPLATTADERLAPLMISPDGKTVTFRDVAPDALMLCVNPSRERFGPRTCFSVGDVRRGRVVRR